MNAPTPEDFGLTDEEVARVEARHDAIGRRLVLALGLTTFAGSACGVIAAIGVAALYPPLARRWSPAYRAACRFADALERHRSRRQGLF